MLHGLFVLYLFPWQQQKASEASVTCLRTTHPAATATHHQQLTKGAVEELGR
ncbi:hypothetical protein [Pontibacter litorisediminis]|uniref:hypothetical protein n=1 Tax=Pontibacter litorisediminis TaxID=1846260 RepID=UPI0023EDC22F|nr:hypothetical protein [Pontibacter litorisediminis]